MKSGSRAGSASHATSSKRKRSSSRTVASKGKKLRGQQKIDSDRVQAIQEALIREHYLTGEASGTWNQTSEDAMRRYQADHGWQSKTVPDSRALIKLGLGPSHDHLLNPDSAMTTQADPPRATPLDPVSHSADPGVPAGKAPAADPVPTPPNDSSSPTGPQ
ncbi:MAG: peptidoglycan-binding domain-containing protein [Candidatus Sulfotelmatobacter sp.]